MPRRKRILPGSEVANLIDSGTGKPMEKKNISVVCRTIRKYRDDHKMEQKELAEKIGVTSNAISNWENGRARPDVDLLPGICRALGITYYDVFDEPDPTAKYTEKEIAILESYRRLSPPHRQAIENMIFSLTSAEAAASLRKISPMRYYEQRLAAGKSYSTDFDDGHETLYLYSSPEIERADSVFRVNGDSMEPTFSDGDMVLVDQFKGKNSISFGDIGAFMIGNEAYIKEYQQDGLHSHNPEYRTMTFTEDEKVYIIGRVIGKLDPSDMVSDEDVDRYKAMYE